MIEQGGEPSQPNDALQERLGIRANVTRDDVVARFKDTVGEITKDMKDGFSWHWRRDTDRTALP